MRSIILGLLILFVAADALAVESRLIHISVNGKKITSKLEVPDGEFDLEVEQDRDGITGFRFHGIDAQRRTQNVRISLSEIKSAEKAFAQTWLPGSPYSFTVKASADFDPRRGGTLRLHALSDWKWIMFKKYGYKDFDILIDVEAGAVRASLKNGNKVERFSKLKINIGLIGASFETE